MRTLRLSFLASTFKLTLGLAKAKLVVREFKLYEYLTYICMRPMAIALNCCVKKYTEQCTLDIRICEKKTRNSLMWGSLMIAPITSRKVSNYKTYSTVQMYSNRNPARHAMNSTAIVIFLPRNSIIRRVNNIPGHRRVYWRECIHIIIPAYKQLLRNKFIDQHYLIPDDSGHCGGKPTQVDMLVYSPHQIKR